MKKRLKLFIHFILRMNRYLNAETYYKEDTHKSKIEIFRDQLYFILKYGNLEPFYFLYGFDRKSMSLNKIISTYIIPYNRFMNKINRLNTLNPIYGMRNGRVITADKFYFNIFLNKFSIPTPQLFLYIKNNNILYVDNNLVKEVETNRVNEDKSIEHQRILEHVFSKDMDAFAKPSDGQSGNGVFSLLIRDKNIFINNELTKIDDLIKIISKTDYIIQQRIIQHHVMASLCPSSINTIRLLTVMDNDRNIIPFAAVLRVGRNGSNIDNWAKGGIIIGIDLEKGTLKKTGFFKPQFGTSCTQHPDTNVLFEDFKIPFFEQAKSLALKLHKYMYRCHSIGWDIAISNNGPVFIEGNAVWTISLVQAANGGMKHIEKYFED